MSRSARSFSNVPARDLEIVRHQHEQVKADLILPHPIGKPANKPLPISIILEKVCLPAFQSPTIRQVT